MTNENKEIINAIIRVAGLESLQVGRVHHHQACHTNHAAYPWYFLGSVSQILP